MLGMMEICLFKMKYILGILLIFMLSSCFTPSELAELDKIAATYEWKIVYHNNKPYNVWTNGKHNNFCCNTNCCSNKIKTNKR